MKKGALKCWFLNVKLVYKTLENRAHCSEFYSFRDAYKRTHFGNELYYSDGGIPS